MDIYTVISNDSVSFYKGGVPFARMLPSIVDGESTIAFKDNDGNDIDIANLEETSQTYDLYVGDPKIKTNGIFSVSVESNSNFNVNNAADTTLQYIDITDYAKGFTGYINVSLGDARQLNFMGKGGEYNIVWIGTNPVNYESGDYIFRYFGMGDNILLLWNIESLSSSGVGYPQLGTEFTVNTFLTSGTVTLPSNVNTVTVHLWGAGGSTGNGGYTTSTISLPDPGMTLYIDVGDAGAAAASEAAGGTATSVYTSHHQDVLIAGGGGVQSGGGLVGLGDSPGTQLTGAFENLDGSGGGYFNGSDGSGGSGFVGSNVVVETNYEDLVPRFDHHTGITYKDTMCHSQDVVVSDYYHNQGGAGDLGRKGKNGFAYVAYEAASQSAFGIDTLAYAADSGELSVTFNESCPTTTWKYFIYEENILIKEGISTALVVPFENRNANVTFFAYAFANTDTETETGFPLGSLRTTATQGPQVPSQEQSAVTSLFNRILIKNMKGFTNVKSIKDGTNFKVAVTDLWTKKTFNFLTTKFPLSVYLTQTSNLQIDTVVVSETSETLTPVYTETLRFDGSTDFLLNYAKGSVFTGSVDFEVRLYDQTFRLLQNGYILNNLKDIVFVPGTVLNFTFASASADGPVFAFKLKSTGETVYSQPSPGATTGSFTVPDISGTLLIANVGQYYDDVIKVARTIYPVPGVSGNYFPDLL